MQTQNDEPIESGSSISSVHVYGRGGALCFEPDVSRHGVSTLAIDGARATGHKVYDWHTKIRIQLNVNELAEIAAVLMGMACRCAVRYHGADNKKHLHLENQGGHFYMRIQHAERLIAVPIPAADGLRAAMLAIAQLKSAFGGADASVILTALRNLGRMMEAEKENGSENGE